MNIYKSLLTGLLLTVACSCPTAKANDTLVRGGTLVGGALLVNTVGYAALDALCNSDWGAARAIKYGLIGGIGSAGVIADILFIKAAVLFKAKSSKPVLPSKENNQREIA